jgi:hypothetical protein
LKQHYLHSPYREKLVEHLLIGELLKLSWKSGDCSLEIARPDVDNGGYDLIAEANGVVRHVQLKASRVGSATSRQKVHVALSGKPSGCVVWAYFDDEDLSLSPFLFFGGPPGQPLTSLDGLPTARHTKANADGYKSERPNIRVLRKRDFRIDSVEDLYAAVFIGTPTLP